MGDDYISAQTETLESYAKFASELLNNLRSSNVEETRLRFDIMRSTHEASLRVLEICAAEEKDK